MSKVYLATTGATGTRGILRKIPALFEEAGFGESISERDLVAIKVHFGELGCSSFVPSFYVREIVSSVMGYGGRPYITDSNVLYLGYRRNAYDHLMTAHKNGFSLSTTGAPIIIGDGLLGSDVEPMEIRGRHFDAVDIVGSIAHSDSLVVVSHVTGHALTGFAGTFKNLGMGCVGRRVKLSIHELVRPKVDEEKCNACATCVKHCPADALQIDKEEKHVVVDLDLCIGCGECINVCPERAITINWIGDPVRAQEKLIEAASAVIRQKGDRISYFDFVITVTPSCDCWSYSAAPMVPDIGVLASRDPLALDQAAADLVIGAPRGMNDAYAEPEKRFETYSGGSWEVQLEYAEELGLGSREYELIRI